MCTRTFPAEVTVSAILAGVGLLAIMSGLYCLNRLYPSRSPAPDVEPVPALRQSTRLEIEYHPSASAYFPTFTRNPGLLDSAEREYLQSLRRASIDDRKSIERLADCLRSGSYSRESPADETTRTSDVGCYRDDEHLSSFVYHDHRFGWFIVTDDGRSFEFDARVSGQWITSLVRELKPFDSRGDCAERLMYYREQMRQTGQHPEPSTWCDTVYRLVARSGPPKQVLSQLFQCPSSKRGSRSDYAMNLNCKPDSPDETVLLFEAKPGWNQHGGPELFTFDNHDPKGGCVLLNDGTVKFIRTEEELKQLRWK